MTTLMPLIQSRASSAAQLNPSPAVSVTTTTSATVRPLPPSTSSDGELISSATNDMDDDVFREPTASGNFAEMLVQDLEASKFVFTSKSMTAGCPSAGLQQASDQYEPYINPGREIIRPKTPRFGRRSASQPRHHSLISGRLDLYDQSSDAEQQQQQQQRQSSDDDINGELEFSDSESEASLGLEPQTSIRTRGQSVTTAATSVSGRRSSSHSQKPNSPSSSTSLPSSPRSPTSPQSPSMAQNSLHHQGTWYDPDADEDGDEDAEAIAPEAYAGVDLGPSHGFPEVQVSRNNYLTFTHRSGGYDDSDHDTEEFSSDSQTSCRIATRFSRLSGYGRSSSLSSILTMQKPRIVDIPPVNIPPVNIPPVNIPPVNIPPVNIPPVNIPPINIPRRRSSLNKGHRRTLSSTSAASLGDLEATKIPGQFERPTGHEGNRHLATAPSMQLLVASKGRAVVDVSRPSLRNLKLATGRRQVSSPLIHDFEEPHYAKDKHVEYQETQYEQMTSTRRRSITTVDAWCDPTVDRLAKPRPLTISPPVRGGILGVPLPPDVIETLRVSISCFPETMLLSSSLSIETIQAYSKKLRHRGRAHAPNHNFPQDTRSVFSSSTSEVPKKSQKRWNIPWFGHSQRDSKKQPRQEQQNQQHSAVHGSPLSPMSAPVPKEVQLDTPLESNWASIKTIFPFGSDYLCDALYAHILAYNYINTLCPPIAQPRLLPRHPSGSSMTDSAAGAGRISEKAASVLGMQALADSNTISASARPASPKPYSQHRRSMSRRFFTKDQPHDERGSVKSRGSTNGASSHFGMNHGGNNSDSVEVQPGIREIHVGLERCIMLLVATLKKTEGDVCGEDDETTSMIIKDKQRESESGEGAVDATLIRALCEVVRMGEVVAP